MNFAALFSFFIAMLAITNPIGNLAIFIGLVSDQTAQQQKQTARAAAIAIFVILILVTWVGNYLLEFFGISAAAFETAGALIIILLGLSMLKGHDNSQGHSALHHTAAEDAAAKMKKSIAVVPLAIPIVAGPGAITTIIIHAQQLNSVLDKVGVSIICAIISVILFICFYFSSRIHRLLGENGVKIATRVMGLILTAIAFQMLGQGLIKLLPGLA